MITMKHARLTAGNVQKGNKKILGSTWSIPPDTCHVGSTLREIEGSTCFNCYDFASYKMYPSVRVGRTNNLELYRAAKSADMLPEFGEALAKQIENISANKAKREEPGSSLHRWFTGGDLQDIEMLRMFVYVANLLPNMRFWLPTREAAIVRKYLASNPAGFPGNLIVRISSAMVDGAPLTSFDHTSTVHTEENEGHACPAYQQGGNCQDCTACWDKSVVNVSYKAH